MSYDANAAYNSGTPGQGAPGAGVPAGQGYGGCPYVLSQGATTSFFKNIR
ncbi:hypothetical protein BLIN101_02620 [Brevibacterium linens]|uniref:Uncharacterized protein n=1 Tax=Brevibacterium linens TaxID=1703 RepID=A0A2H1JSB9_BRELN|nr:hypothetical protein BLIN101_02620 [Brevibacterium linens]